jgi:hypothetical protein
LTEPAIVGTRRSPPRVSAGLSRPARAASATRAPASEVSREAAAVHQTVVSQILDIDAVAESPDPRAMLLAELADFVTRHRPCGQLTGDGTEPVS